MTTAGFFKLEDDLIFSLFSIFSVWELDAAIDPGSRGVNII
jgi:hypothetical protein